MKSFNYRIFLGQILHCIIFLLYITVNILTWPFSYAKVVHRRSDLTPVQLWSKEPLALEGCEASYQIVTGYWMSVWRRVGHERPHSLHGQTGIESVACSDWRDLRQACFQLSWLKHTKRLLLLLRIVWPQYNCCGTCKGCAFYIYEKQRDTKTVPTVGCIVMYLGNLLSLLPVRWWTYMFYYAEDICEHERNMWQ